MFSWSWGPARGAWPSSTGALEGRDDVPASGDASVTTSPQPLSARVVSADRLWPDQFAAIRPRFCVVSRPLGPDQGLPCRLQGETRVAPNPDAGARAAVPRDATVTVIIGVHRRQGRTPRGVVRNAGDR
jgi:hypothetical protein